MLVWKTVRYPLVGSCHWYRGASAVWFITHWWHLTASFLISVWPHCTPEPWSTSTWCSASDGGYIRSQKTNGQLEKTTGPPSQRMAQQGSGGCQCPTAIYAVEVWDRQGSWSGTTVHKDYATMMMISITVNVCLTYVLCVRMSSRVLAVVRSLQCHTTLLSPPPTCCMTWTSTTCWSTSTAMTSRRPRWRRWRAKLPNVHDRNRERYRLQLCPVSWYSLDAVSICYWSAAMAQLLLHRTLTPVN